MQHLPHRVVHAAQAILNSGLEGVRLGRRRRVWTPLGGRSVDPPRCENPECAHTTIAFCSCRNRHCPKCQGSQALAWMEKRKAELLEVPYFHIVLTLLAEIAAIAYQNKAVTSCSRLHRRRC